MTRFEKPQDQTVEYARRLSQLVHGTTAPLHAWGRFFIDPEQQKSDPRLAAQAFSIYFVTLYDVAELTTQSKLPKFANEARDLGLGTIGLSADILCSKFRFAVKLLSRVPWDLQLVVRAYRDECVHGPLVNYTNPKVVSKYLENQKLIRIEISQSEFRALFSSCVNRYGSIDGALSEASKIALGDSYWFNEVDPLFVDPRELQSSLENGAIPYPWQDGVSPKASQ